MAYPAAAGDDAERPTTPTQSASLARYDAAKKNVGAAIKSYLDEAIKRGSDDPSSTLELARQILLNEANEAVDRRLLAVPLTGVWAEMTHKDTQVGDRADEAGT